MSSKVFYMKQNVAIAQIKTALLEGGYKVITEYLESNPDKNQATRDLLKFYDLKNPMKPEALPDAYGVWLSEAKDWFEKFTQKYYLMTLNREEDQKKHIHLLEDIQSYFIDSNAKLPDDLDEFIRDGLTIQWQGEKCLPLAKELRVG